jgi:hypothetical protein
MGKVTPLPITSIKWPFWPSYGCSHNVFLPAFLAFAHRALAAAESRFLATALSFRLGPGACGLGESERRLPFGRFPPAKAVMALLRASRCCVSWLIMSVICMGLRL